MSTSTLQRQVSSLLSYHFGGYTIRENRRPEWLVGPNGERLELDFLVEELSIAIEVQGQQHYIYVPHFHENYEQFLEQQARDQAKRDVCEMRGIQLLEVYDELSAEEAITAIKQYCSASSNGYVDPPTAKAWTRIVEWETALKIAIKNQRYDILGYLNHKIRTSLEHAQKATLDAKTTQYAQHLVVMTSQVRCILRAQRQVLSIRGTKADRRRAAKTHKKEVHAFINGCRSALSKKSQQRANATGPVIE